MKSIHIYIYIESKKNHISINISLSLRYYKVTTPGAASTGCFGGILEHNIDIDTVIIIIRPNTWCLE